MLVASADVTANENVHFLGKLYAILDREIGFQGSITMHSGRNIVAVNIDSLAICLSLI